MKKFVSFYFVTVVFILIACGSNPTKVDTGTIEGIIYNFNSGDVVGKANIVTVPPSSSVTSDSISGSFKILHVDPGVYRVRAKKVGYDSTGVNITVLAGEKTIADIALRIDSTYVDTLAIP